jgi:hypothetical protein
VSKAGRFKDLDPSYSAIEVRKAWVINAQIVYVGKAAGAKGLKKRIRQLVDFGFGKAVGHRGGRLIWHLRGHQTLQLRWRLYSRLNAEKIESRLIKQFKAFHGKRPFANRNK